MIVDSHKRILASHVSPPEDLNIPSTDFNSPTEIPSDGFIAPPMETIASTIITPNMDNEAMKEGKLAGTLSLFTNKFFYKHHLNTTPNLTSLSYIIFPISLLKSKTFSIKFWSFHSKSYSILVIILIKFGNDLVGWAN